MTKQQAAAALSVILAVGDAIRELKEVPSGHLYAQLMAKMSLDQYNAIIDILIEAKMVKRSRSHLLTWIGPAKGETNDPT